MQFKIASVDSIIVEFSQTISLDISKKIKFYYETLKHNEGMIELIPSYTTLYIQYDIYKYNFETLSNHIRNIIHDESENVDVSKTIKIPVYYGLDVGWDLERISQYNNISIDDIIAQHTSDIYTVYAIGFAPGFAYLGEVDKSIAMSRLSSPRKMVPKGAVAIADTQTAIYPKDSPGGWNVIGKTIFNMFDPSLPDLCPVTMGDRVQFESIDKQTFLELGGVL